MGSERKVVKAVAVVMLNSRSARPPPFSAAWTQRSFAWGFTEQTVLEKNIFATGAAVSETTAPAKVLDTHLAAYYLATP